MTKTLYTGVHIHHALTCFKSGHLKNAASWMELDYGEINEKWGFGTIDHNSIEVVHDGILFSTFAETRENMQGAGI